MQLSPQPTAAKARWRLAPSQVQSSLDDLLLLRGQAEHIPGGRLTLLAGTASSQGLSA